MANAYAFNLDRSKAPVYTKEEIDQIDLVNDQALAQEVADRQAAVQQEASDRAAAVSIVDARIDNIIANPLTEEAAIEELVDIRTRSDGMVCSTAGNAMRSLEKTIESIVDMQQSFDLFNGAVWVQGTINGQTHEDSEATNRLRTGFINVSAIDSVSFSVETGYKFIFYAYDSDKSYVDWRNWTTGSGVLKFPDTAVFVKFLLANTSDSTIEVGEAVNLSMTYQRAIHSVERSIYGLEQNLKAIALAQSFDLTSGTTWKQGGINGVNGTDTEATNRIRTDFIDVSIVDSINISLLNNYRLICHFYNSTKSMVSKVDWFQGNKTIAVPSTAAYIKLVLANENETTIVADDAINLVATYETAINSIFHKVKNDGVKTKTVVIQPGATSGTWAALIGYNAPIMVRCDSPNVVNTYRVWTAPSAYTTCDVGVTYYFDSIRGDGSEIQLYLDGLVKSDGVVVGGDVIFTFALQADIILPNTVDGFVIKDESIDASKLSRSVKSDIPTYYDSEYEATLQSVETLALASPIRFAFMTDLHYPSISSEYNLGLRTGIENMFKAVAKMSKQLGFSIVVANGDYVQLPTVANGQTKQQGIDVIADLNNWMSAIDSPKIAIAGNHEENYSGGGTSYGLTDQEIKGLIAAKYAVGEIKKASDRVYYLIDSFNEIMYLFISTTSLVALADEVNVTEGILSAIAANSNNYPIIAFNHFVGEGSSIYTQVGQRMDFIKSSGGNLIAWIGGHQHSDWSYVHNGTLAISCLQSGYWTNNPSQDGTTYAHVVGTATESAFSIFTVNKTLGKIYCTRFGLGVDREFNYNTTSGTIGLVS